MCRGLGWQHPDGPRLRSTARTEGRSLSVSAFENIDRPRAGNYVINVSQIMHLKKQKKSMKSRIINLITKLSGTFWALRNVVAAVLSGSFIDFALVMIHHSLLMNEYLSNANEEHRERVMEVLQCMFEHRPETRGHGQPGSLTGLVQTINPFGTALQVTGPRPRDTEKEVFTSHSEPETETEGDSGNGEELMVISYESDGGDGPYFGQPKDFVEARVVVEQTSATLDVVADTPRPIEGVHCQVIKKSLGGILHQIFYYYYNYRSDPMKWPYVARQKHSNTLLTCPICYQTRRTKPSCGDSTKLTRSREREQVGKQQKLNLS